MVAELCSDPRSLTAYRISTELSFRRPLHAMSAAAGAAAAAAAAQPQLDPMAMQIWVAEVESRLDAQATRTTG